MVTKHPLDEKSIREIIREEISKTRPDWVDEIMGELKTTREEQILLGGRQSEHSDQLEDHETRIVSIEQNPLLSS